MDSAGRANPLSNVSSVPGAPPPADHPLETLTQNMPPQQRWTISGYPIVDGKYLDLSTGELKMHVDGVDLVMAGPPSIAIWWQNRVATGRPDQFSVISKGGVVGARDLTEYMTRVGDFLKRGLCQLNSLNATRYDVYIVVSSEMTHTAFRNALEEGGLL